MDGFPIYGPYAASGKLMQGSSAGRNATLGACNFDVRFVDQSINQSINQSIVDRNAARCCYYYYCLSPMCALPWILLNYLLNLSTRRSTIM
jgi:hypothetical protein